MTTAAETNAIVDGLDRVAQQTFDYFAGPGKTTAARVDQWGARDVLMHFIYFHNATAWGIRSVAQGGPPWVVSADADTVNAVCRWLHERESVDELLAQLRQAHARLVRAARESPDLDVACFRRSTGETSTVRQRLEVITKHWAEHVEALRAASR